ncbi:MAG: NAD(P)/FAD-dependent oxidoreductase [Vicinamibacterales bacterium]
MSVTVDPIADVLVIGGGPAGSSAAKLLAGWGHSVRLVKRPAGDARLAESLPPSCGKLFDAIGLRNAIDQSGFIRSTGNTVWWGSDVPRVELFADGGRGWQVEANALASLLLDEATRTGVTVERRVFTADESRAPSPESRATSPEPRSPSPDPRSPFLLDCSGRAGVLARAYGLRQYDEGPRTIALVASWHSERDWNVPDASHTIVESYEGGWAWSVPTSTQHRHIAVMVDPQRSGLTRGSAAREVYLAEMAKTREFRSLVHDATFESGPWGWDASMYHAQRYADDGWLLAGDAGSFIDPLSSAGVKKALASGWLAAVVTHTCLTRPEMRQHALRFFGDRETEIHQRFARMARRMLADAAVGHSHRFWADRWDETHEGPLESDGEAAEVRGAFERLRQSSVFNVRRGAGVLVEPRPAVSGSEIVLERRIVSADRPSGIRFVRDVDVIALIDLAPQYSAVPDLFDAYCRRSGPVGLPDFLRALATTLAKGWLVSQ